MNLSSSSLCGLSTSSEFDGFHTRHLPHNKDSSYSSISSQIERLATLSSTTHKFHTTSSTTPPSSQPDSNSVPLEQRRHPRRSQACALQKPPPTLVRQEERKATFVDGLVDSAAQMVEVIWPLSIAHNKPHSGGVLSLRRYIEETLRRSRTSYSTLQVALYYLVLIMPCVPKSDFAMQQSVDSSSVRALQCGRRMFLAALILASKYLQDRNYSAKAWSKMSGLKVAEINLNERAFLEAVNWKLHLPEPLFKRWTEVVLRYTPGQSPPSAGLSEANFASDENETLTWKDIIPKLTPNLEFVAPLAAVMVGRERSESPVAAYTTLPSYLEPQPEVRPPTPILGVTYLPTPRSTPSPVRAPAVSIARAELCEVGKFSRRSSFSSQVSSELSPASMLSEASRLSPASSVTSVGSFNSYTQDCAVKIPFVGSNTCFSVLPSQLTAYDAQPQVSRAVKRSQEHISGSEEEERREALQMRTCSLLNNKHHGTKSLPIVLDDEDCVSNSMAAAVASSHAQSWCTYSNASFVGEDRKRVRVA